MYDLTGYYSASFFLGGVAGIIGGILMIPVRAHSNQIKKTCEETIKSNNTETMKPSSS